MTIDTMADMKKALKSQIEVGRAKAIKGDVLAQRLGERDTRQIRLAMQELIEEGIPVIGSSKPPFGYYIAENADECKECLEQLRHYLKMVGRHHKYLLKAMGKRFSGQLSMPIKEE